MKDSPELRPAPLKTRREEVIRVLQTAFADDHLSVEELERRLGTARSRLQDLLKRLRFLEEQAGVGAAQAR